MPAKSKAQMRLMQGIAHGSIPSKGGLSRAKAKEFAEATPKGAKLTERKGRK